MTSHNGHRVKMHLDYDECECGQIIPRAEGGVPTWLSVLLAALLVAAVGFTVSVAL